MSDDMLWGDRLLAQRRGFEFQRQHTLHPILDGKLRRTTCKPEECKNLYLVSGLYKPNQIQIDWVWWIRERKN